MRKLTAMLVASSLALSTVGIAQANEAPKGPMPDARMMKDGRAHHGMEMEKMFNGLNLTEAQKQQIKEIKDAAHENRRKAMQDERRELHSLVTSDTFDAAKAQAQLDKADAARKANMLSALETQNKIYNILTPEQKKQYNENYEKRLTQQPKRGGMEKPPVE
ncbi:ATP-independent periplasmic protein-refolding chaperone Spy [Brenneria rubrifaciens]|uniref:ATP-independent periplasmic protein-refolding chaperone n=1 Tax=Brenneria rubrifaciens TaxID=55213 RepID=A0A4V1FA90_9GAMM|nr:ATP-independent periplasmic protein-refolding chaperone Spy [Brenneria rubrifaciens]QCR10243.1 ATP-independent periplasmic protein-refolding chaperone [Brenneria rubrifaciens]